MTSPYFLFLAYLLAMAFAALVIAFPAARSGMRLPLGGVRMHWAEFGENGGMQAFLRAQERKTKKLIKELLEVLALKVPFGNLTSRIKSRGRDN
jgi:hypothetical protein